MARGARRRSRSSASGGVARHRAVGPDARARRARRGAARRCGRRSSGTTGAPAPECAEIEERIGLERADRADRQPRADRASRRRSSSGCAGTSRSVYARIAHVLLPKDYVRLPAHAASTRSTWPTRRGRCSSTSPRRRWSDEVLAALDLPARLAAAALESPSRAAARRRAVAAAPATRPRRARRRRRPARAACRSCSARRASSSRRCPASRRSARRACTPSATPCPGAWHAMGVMLSAAGSLRWLRDALAPACRSTRSSRRPSAGRPGVEGLIVPPLPRRRAHAARRPRRARRVRRASSLRHDRGALARAVLEGVAFGLRDSLDLLARARRRAGRRPRLGRRRAQRAVAADRRVGARAAARADGGRRGRGVRRGAARRRRGRACSTSARRRSRRACGRARSSSRAAPGRRHTRGGVRSLPPALPGAEGGRMLGLDRSRPLGTTARFSTPPRTRRCRRGCGREPDDGAREHTPPSTGSAGHTGG